ncbi:MAG: helix-turn-helix domain-containing protein [Acidimicrobiales bacterium]
MTAIVGADEDKVEADLLAGLLACPDCKGPLFPWGHARSRPVRRGAEEKRIHPRRSICPRCGGSRGKTHVLLPDSTLIRRRDHVEVIVSAIEAKAAGESRASIASRLGVNVTTVRGWLRAFVRNAEAIRSLFTRWARVLDPLGGPIEPEATAFQDALSAIGVAVCAAVLRFGPKPPSALVSALSSGALLCNANILYRAAVIA